MKRVLRSTYSLFVMLGVIRSIRGLPAYFHTGEAPGVHLVAQSMCFYGSVVAQSRVGVHITSNNNRQYCISGADCFGRYVGQYRSRYTGRCTLGLDLGWPGGRPGMRGEVSNVSARHRASKICCQFGVMG